MRAVLTSNKLQETNKAKVLDDNNKDKYLLNDNKKLFIENTSINQSTKKTTFSNQIMIKSEGRKIFSFLWRQIYVPLLFFCDGL
jgi:hypothetical protein